ncbi:MAG: MFS transporter [Firmicutes bacterium]|jgi:MFS family permease|nr:MFS transporter [Dethiobacter sp.]MBS4009115.1 MFS transporter [Clostridium sp.]MCL5992892.1 MFS transporter [Bacillota bacterium]
MKITQSRQDKNYKAILTANAFVSFADGFYYPLLLAFLIDIGDVPLLGLGLGIITIFDSLSSYVAGELSDTHGRKPYLVASAIISPAIFIAYPLLPLLEQVSRELMLTALLLLLIIDGITDGVWDTVEAIYLGDITVKVFRGSRMGTYWGIGGTIFGTATIIAGFSGLHIDFLASAIIVSLIYLAGIFMLLRIKESAPKPD